MNTLTNLKYTLAVTAGLCSSFAYAQNHPHIILIMTDQQRAVWETMLLSPLT